MLYFRSNTVHYGFWFSLTVRSFSITLWQSNTIDNFYQIMNSCSLIFVDWTIFSITWWQSNTIYNFDQIMNSVLWFSLTLMLESTKIKEQLFIILIERRENPMESNVFLGSMAISEGESYSLVGGNTYNLFKLAGSRSSGIIQFTSNDADGGTDLYRNIPGKDYRQKTGNFTERNCVAISFSKTSGFLSILFSQVELFILNDMRVRWSNRVDNLRYWIINGPSPPHSKIMWIGWSLLKMWCNNHRQPFPWTFQQCMNFVAPNCCVMVRSS